MKLFGVALCFALLACGKGSDSSTNPSPQKDPHTDPENDPEKKPEKALEGCVLSQLDPATSLQQSVALGVKIKKVCHGSDESIQTILNERN